MASDNQFATRRAVLLGITAASVITPSAPAMPILATSPDAELLAACANYHAWHNRSEQAGISERDLEDAGVAREKVLHRIATLIPASADGLRAKAEVAHSALVWRLTTSVDRDWRYNASPEELIAADVLARTAERP